MSEEEYKIQEPNFTQIPNVLFDEWLEKLGHAELKVLLVIYRKTFGYHKTKDKISLKQLEEHTGFHRKYIIKATQELEKKKLITKTTTGEIGQQETVYEAIISYTKDREEGGLPKATGGGCLKLRGGGCLKLPTKERDINKYINKKESKPKKKTEHSSLASTEAHECSKYISKKYNEYRESNSLNPVNNETTNAWLSESNKLLKQYSKEKIYEIVDFAFEDKFWKKTIKSPAGLRNNFTSIEDLVAESKHAANKANEIIESNTKWIITYYEHRERIGAMGLMHYNSEQVWDEKSNISWSYSDPKMQEKILKFYKNYR